MRAECGAICVPEASCGPNERERKPRAMTFNLQGGRDIISLLVFVSIATTAAAEPGTSANKLCCTLPVLDSDAMSTLLDSCSTNSRRK